MKREFVEEKQHDHRSFFSAPKLQTQNFNIRRQPPSPPPEDVFTAEGLKPVGDGATIEVVRRPRGRPPGSKNKPKPPMVIAAEEANTSMIPYVLELPGGVDVVESTGKFCRKKGIGLAVLSGHGVISNVTLKQPSPSHGAAVAFHGRFDILAISATILPGDGGDAVGKNAGEFTIFLGGPQGQVIGGLVVGPLVAAGTIFLIAATFNGPTVYRLPVEENSGDGAGDSPPQTAVSGGDSGGAPMYNDVVWAPTARAPPPPPARPY